MVEMVVRLIVLGLFCGSLCVLIYAYKTMPYVSHLIGWIVWCIHVIIFTAVATLYGLGIVYLDHHLLNVWSSAIRLQAGLTIASTGIYYILIWKEFES